jgi:hypothetical protein
MDVDLIVLSRDRSPLRPDVDRAIRRQQGVAIRLHRLTGARSPRDRHRWETICRARNRARTMGTSPWVMCLDDDVVPGRECVARLVEGLEARPVFAALAADSAGEMAGDWQNWDYPDHVGMAAVLFRREVLKELTFRWEDAKCECLCCCEDLRRAGLGIGYHPGAIAWHRPDRTANRPHERTSCRPGPEHSPDATPARVASSLTPRILSSFDRRDLGPFRRQFLPTLRAAGNQEPVSVVAYGLYPSERRLVEASGVEVLARPTPDVTPAVLRLRDFQHFLARWPAETPVAFWDAGDILFQARLDPLWDLVRAHPDRLLAAREPLEIGGSPAVATWTDPIRDPETRHRARHLLMTRPSINGGFAAGTAAAMLRWCREGVRLLDTSLRDVYAFGDQLAMAFHLFERPENGMEVSETWNYCLLFRDPRTYGRGADGRVVSRDGTPVAVVHGNGRSLTGRTLAYL